jgi:hypothetical protein
MDTIAPIAKPKSKVTVVRVVVWGGLLALLVWLFAIRQGKSVTSALTGPSVIKDEQVQLKEGNWKAYGFNLFSSSKVEIHITGNPKSVDVLTVEGKDFAEFQKASKAIFGGKYHYIPSLSSQRVTKYDGSGVLPQGEWYVIVMRPQESLLFGDDTNATVKILGY